LFFLFFLPFSPLLVKFTHVFKSYAFNLLVLEVNKLML